MPATHSKQLSCGLWITTHSNRNPFTVYDDLKDLKTHFDKCLPCLLKGSFKSQMDKEIQKLLLATLLRVVGIVTPWAILFGSFYLLHRDHPISDYDFPFIFFVLCTLGLTCACVIADGPREYD